MGNAQSPEVLLLEVGTLQSHFPDCGRMTLADGEAGSNDILPLLPTIDPSEIESSESLFDFWSRSGIKPRIRWHQ